MVGDGKAEFTEHDFRNAQILYEKEQIKPLTEANLFRASLYCILSAAENYTKLMRVYTTLLDNKIDTPENIASNRQTLDEIVGKSRKDKQKKHYIYDLACWWPGSNLPKDIVEDAHNSRQKEFELRNGLAKDAPGLGYKCASLLIRMCGYENIVPVDIHVQRFLKEKGCAVRVTDYKTQPGLTKKEYLEYEQMFTEIAKSRNITPAKFQYVLWVKRSSWNPTKESQLHFWKRRY
jgi:thermostable 8-oxoguanine DNA glycosylase